MLKRAFLLSLILVLIGLTFNLNSKTYAAIDCLKITVNSPKSERDFCRSELAQIEAELADLLDKQVEQKKNTGTLEGDVKYLNSQISALRTKIKARSLAIAELKVSIIEKESKIEDLNAKIEKQYESLAQLIRNTNDLDNNNLVYVLLSNQSISQFYADVESYASIKQAVKSSVDQIKSMKDYTEVEKQALEQKQNQEADAKYELENTQTKVAKSEAEKKKLLSISKEKEKEYEQIAKEKKILADKIRAALFQLRDSDAIPFGLALEYALEVEKQTGVRPAFLLAIITQETNLGANVGTCNRPQDPPEKAWDQIMKPSRDIEPFIEITNALGMGQAGVPLSCPWGSGWGGAMGPSQFIPSTWMMYAKKVAARLGISGMPDPWNPQHAFMASGIYLGELGASEGGYTAERKAALKYYAGGNWWKSSNAFYGNQVMSKAAQIQEDIDVINGI